MFHLCSRRRPLGPHAPGGVSCCYSSTLPWTTLWVEWIRGRRLLWVGGHHRPAADSDAHEYEQRVRRNAASKLQEASCEGVHQAAEQAEAGCDRDCETSPSQPKCLSIAATGCTIND
jgi:hypothetical protein